MNAPRISMICALGTNRAIGRGNALLWHISEDLKRFKRLTLGHPVIMGRKTHESIGCPLPGRTNIIITRRLEYEADGCVVAHSLEEAIALARRGEPANGEIFIIGGGEVYAQAIERADRLYLTAVDEAPADADTFFPAYEGAFRVRETLPGDADGLRYSYLLLDRTE